MFLIINKMWLYI